MSPSKKRKRREEKKLALLVVSWWAIEALQLIEEEPTTKRRRRLRNYERLFEVHYVLLWRKYFCPSLPRHLQAPPDEFRKKYRMSECLFYRILEDVVRNDAYFVRKKDALGNWGLYPEQKILAALKFLATGGSYEEVVGEYFNLAQPTLWFSVQHFCDGIIQEYEQEYLRSPTQQDVNRLTRENKERCFPGMLGSLDCMHWSWHNCPTAWKGQYTGKNPGPTVVLEAICSYDTWFWHAYFGMSGANNDINVLHSSPLVAQLFSGSIPTPDEGYVINGRSREKPYFLTDGIYPNWGCFVKSLPVAVTEAEKKFVKIQEGVRKDVERSFGVLFSQFHILHNVLLELPTC